LKTLAVSAVALLVLTSVSYSQGRKSGENPNTEAAEMDAAAAQAIRKQKQQQELDAAYNAALKQKKPPPAPTDPWGGVRPAGGAATGH